MRRIGLIFGSVTVLALTSVALPHAAQASPDTGVTCHGYQLPFTAAIDNSYSWSSPTGSHTVFFDTPGNGTLTMYCGEPQGGHIYKAVQYGLQRCLAIDTSTGTVVDGNCNSVYAEWNEIAITSGPQAGDYLEQNWGNKACLKFQGDNVSMGWMPCDSYNIDQIIATTPFVVTG